MLDFLWCDVEREIVSGGVRSRAIVFNIFTRLFVLDERGCRERGEEMGEVFVVLEKKRYPMRTCQSKPYKIPPALLARSQKSESLFLFFFFFFLLATSTKEIHARTCYMCVHICTHTVRTTSTRECTYKYLSTGTTGACKLLSWLRHMRALGIFLSSLLPSLVWSQLYNGFLRRKKGLFLFRRDAYYDAA